LGSDPVTITPDRRLLLRAALDEPESALRCFAEWWKNVDIDDTGSTEYRLLPVVHHNIGHLIPDKAAAARVKGVAKHAWLSNYRYAAIGKFALDGLSTANVPTMILKGGAMMVAVSGENMRSMADCDILVPIERAPQALAALAELGLHEPVLDARRFTAYDFRKIHGLMLLRAGEHESHLDIHWRPFYDVAAKELANEFFDRSVPCSLLGVETRRPCFEHMLLHAVYHGTFWDEVLRYDWLADAALILRTAGATFDWDFLAESVGRYRLGQIVRPALNELAETLDVPMPAYALRRLPQGGAIERAEAHWRSMDPAIVPTIGRRIMALQALRRRAARLPSGSAWRLLSEIWRDVFGPPPRALMPPATVIDAEDRVIFLMGWSWLELSGRWTDGLLATLAIKRAPGHKGHTLRLAGSALHRPGKPQVINVYSGWRRLARLTWGGGRHYVEVIPLPPALCRREVLMLQLRIRAPAVPASLGLSRDMRRLGLFLQDCRIISPCVRDAAATPLNLHHDSGDLAVLWSGWLHPESEGCWNDGPNAVLRWISPRDLPADARIVIRGLGFAPDGKALRGSISINGRRAGDLEQLNHVSGPVDLSVPLGTLGVDREINVHIHFDNPRSPRAAGISSDERRLGLFLQSVRIDADVPYGRRTARMTRNDVTADARSER
jgi:hypothetical protein